MVSMQELLDEISILFAAPVTLESPEFELIAFGVHDAAHGAPRDLDPVRMQSILGRSSTAETRAWFESFGIAAATGPVRTPADREHGIAARLCLPVRYPAGGRGRLLGYVWLLDDGQLEERPERADALVAELAATLAANEPGVDLAAVISGGPQSPSAVEALAALLPARVAVGPCRGPVPVALVTIRATVRGGPAGIGPIAMVPAELAESYAAARFAALVAAATDLGPVARWEDLGAYRMLRDVPAADPVLEVLADTPDLQETLEVYLDQAGNVAKAAAALHIHRQTLYYRLSRIEALTGCDLGDGRARLLLHMSVKLARLGR
jgi:hypothetical protein